MLLQDERSTDSLDRLWADLERIEQNLEASKEEPLHSVLELRGLGKEIWTEIDVDDYIREERASWR